MKSKFAIGSFSDAILLPVKEPKLIVTFEMSGVGRAVKLSAVTKNRNT